MESLKEVYDTLDQPGFRWSEDTCSQATRRYLYLSFYNHVCNVSVALRLNCHFKACFSKEVSKNFAASVQTFLKHYSFLAKRAFVAKLCRWSIVSKHHMTAHMPSMAKHLAPRHYWTYGSESFMGFMSHLANACLAGMSAHKIPWTVMFKYRTFWQLLFKRLLVLDD